MRPFIGISMSRDNTFKGYSRDWVRSTYVEAIIDAGGIPVLLANSDSSLKVLHECHGLLLTGGGDIDPALFGSDDDGTDWGGVSADRDQSELAFINEANRLDMPIFGICRGLQVLTVGFGGSLIQDIPRARQDSQIHHSQSEPREDVTHVVRIHSGSKLERMVQSKECSVNSFHHQAINRVPQGWQVSAEAPDGIIEAMEYPGDRFLIGVQWHPEDLWKSEASSKALFAHFVQSAEQYQLQGRNYVENSH